MHLIPYIELVKVPVFFYKMIGQEMLEPDPTLRLQAKLLKVLFYFGMINYHIQLSGEIAHFFVSLKLSSMMELTAVAPCMLFGCVGSMKLSTLNRNKLAIRGILQKLENIYPNTKELQREYNLERHVKTLKPVMNLFASICLLNTFFFGLIPVILSTASTLITGTKFDYPMGFPIWHPYDRSKNWLLYALSYWLQIYAGYMAGVAFLTADLLLVSSVSQLSFHFEYIAKTLEEFQPKSDEENLKFLTGILNHHRKCLDLSESLDSMFSFSLLLNFLASSGTICFVGFQVVSASTEEIVRYSVLLVTSLSQVFIICIYGNKLIDSSEAIGEAAFGHSWYECNLVYRKLVVLMICRSQKCAAIHVPTFPPISLVTFMKVITMAYQFFTVLQTTSSND